MRTTATGLAVLLTIPALLLTAACGGGEEAAKGDGTPGTGQRQDVSGSDGEALSRTRLEKAVLAKGDLDGYQVERNDEAASKGVSPRTEDADCAPIADVSGERPTPDTGHIVRRGVGTPTSARTGATLSVSLISTSRGGAGELMRGLKRAVPRCGQGFEVTVEGRKATYTKIRPMDAQSPGDETVAFGAVLQARGQRLPMNFVVTREGSTLAVFVGMNLSGAKPALVPQVLLDKQLDKLARA